jgi:hypothetical protein
MSEQLSESMTETPILHPERRRKPRLRSLLSGAIVFDDKCTMDCTVRNISAYGAKVVLADAFRLPQAFTLRIPHHDQAHRATVVWRKGDAAGLALADVQDTARPARPRMTRREQMLAEQRAHQKDMDAAQF